MNGDINKVMDNSAEGVDPSVNISRGVPASDPAAQRAMQSAMKTRGIDIARAGLMGAGAGAQAAQGSINPLAAFVQGAAAGLQVPSQLYAAKQKQIQSTIDATPFGVTHPEIAADGPYKILAGLPTAIALEVIGGIAKDTAKVTAEGMEGRKNERFKFDLETIKATIKKGEGQNLIANIELANKFNSLPKVKSFESIEPAYTDIVTIRNRKLPIEGDPKKNVENRILADKTMVIKYAQMLNPNMRISEGTMDTLEGSGVIDQMTKQLWAKVKGQGTMSDGERDTLVSLATQIYNNSEKDYNKLRGLTALEAAKEGYNPAFILDKGRIVEIESIGADGRPSRSFARILSDGSAIKVK